MSKAQGKCDFPVHHPFKYFTQTECRLKDALVVNIVQITCNHAINKKSHCSLITIILVCNII